MKRITTLTGGRMIVWSYGGGVQSAAIAAMVCHGDLPRPDLAVIADTGREAETTWSYLRGVVNPALGRIIEVAPHDLSSVDLYALNGDLLIPAFTQTGKLPTFCSTEWKRRVVQRWLRQRGVDSCEMWLGISWDESERCKPSSTSWITHSWPLIDKRMRRSDCLRVVSEMGWPEPPRSACWMCPLRNDADWLSLTDGDRARAEALDLSLRERDERGGVFLHRSKKPLADRPYAHGQSQVPLDLCDSGHCWT